MKPCYPAQKQNRTAAKKAVKHFFAYSFSENLFCPKLRTFYSFSQLFSSFLYSLSALLCQNRGFCIEYRSNKESNQMLTK